MRLLWLLTLVALAYATSRIPDRRWLDQLSRSDLHVSDTEFRPEREYKFLYNGQLAIGIPGSSSQHSATRIQALVSLIFKTKTEVYLNVLDVRMGKLNDNMPNPRNILPFDTFEHIPLHEQLKQKLMAPIKFHYKHGMISEVVFDRVEQPWSANIKRGILNMLQVNLNKQRRTDMTDEALISRSVAEIQAQQNDKPEVDFYSVMENTIEGECETFYTITSQPARHPRVHRPVLNVTKSINFEKCNRRPEIKYNYRFQDWCPTCEARYNTQERMLRSSTIAKYNMTVSESKEDFLLESVIVESHYTYVPFNEEDSLINTYVNQTLVLIKTSQIESPLREIHDPIPSDSQLIFTPDWDIAKERFFMDGESEFQNQHSYPELGNKVEFVKKILQSLAHYMNEKVEEEAPRHFTRLVKVMRLLKAEELESVHQHFFKQQPEAFTPEEHKRIKSLLPDAVARCGTKVCVDHIVNKIAEGEVRGLKAVVAINQLNDIRVVSEHMIEKLWTLTESEVVRRNPILRQSVYLTIGTLINALCSENEDKLAVEFKIKSEKLCPRALKEKFTQRLFSELRNSQHMYEKVLLLKTIGNAGIDMSIFELEKIIKNVDKVYSRIERIEAIFALRQLKDWMPRKVQKILMPVFLNKQELPTVRMAAILYLMQTMPEKPILDQITRSLFVEKNIQVASFVFTKLHTLANSTNPCEKKLADELKLSLRHSRFLPVSSWITHSQFHRVQVQDHKQKVGMAFDFVNIKSNDSLLPNIFGANVHTNFGSMWNKYLGSVSFTQFGLDHWLRRVLRSQSHNLQSSMSRLFRTQFNRDSSEQQQQEDSDDQEERQERVNPRFNHRQELRTLFNSLSVSERNMYDSEPFGMLSIKFKDQEYAFLPLVKELIPEEYIEMITRQDSSLSNLFNKVKRFLTEDISIPLDITTASFIHEQSRKIPTTIGIPVQIGFKIPTVFQTTGMIKLDLDKTDSFRKIKVVFSHMRPSFVSTLITKVESWTPIVNSGLKVIAQTKMFMPMDGSVTLDTQKSPMEVKFTWEPLKALRTTGPIEFITVQSRPITTTLVWPRQLTQWKEPEERTIHETEYNRVKEHNVVFGEQVLGLKVHSRGQWHSNPKHCVCWSAMCWCDQFLPLAGPNKWTVTVEPGHDTPKEFTLTISGKLFETIDKLKMRPQFDNFFTENNEEYLEKSEITDNYKKFETYGSNKHFINMILETKGSSTRRHVQLSTDCFCSDDMRNCKCKLAVERSPIPSMESEPWKMTSEIETLFPQTAYSVSELTSDKKLMTRVKITWGPQSNMDKHIDMKIVGDRSESMKKMLDQSIYKRIYDVEEQRNQYKSQFSPVAQFSKVIQYGKLNEYKVDIDYKVNPWVKNITNKFYRVLKSIYFWKTEINDFKPEYNQQQQEQHYPVESRMTPENKIRAKFTIDPMNLRFLNLSINTPREVAIIRDIPLWTAFEPLNLRRPSTPTFYQKSRNTVYDMVTKLFSSESTRPTCEVREDSITTFDKVEVNVPITTCYTVLAKDCEDQNKPTFAILLKKDNDNEELKTMKIITKSQKLVLRGKTDEEMEILLNGEPKTIEDLEEVKDHGHVVLRCTKSGPYVKCELPDIHVNVFFDGLSASVKVSSMYRNTVCGLCGDNDQEQEDEMTSADNIPFRSVPDMYKSYLVRDNECTLDEQKLNQPKRYERRQFAWEQDQDQDVYDRYSTQRYNQYKTQPKQQQQQQERTRDNSGEYSNERQQENINDQDDDSEESTEYSSRREQQGESWETSPIKATKMIEQNHQVCFSKIPVPKCPRGTYTKNYKEQPLKVAYVCLPRSDLQTETYIRLAVREQQPIREIEQMAATFTEMEIVPRSCRKN